MDFVFKKEHREICFDTYKSSPGYLGELSNIAEKIATSKDKNFISVSSEEISLLDGAINRGIIKVEESTISFTEEIFLIFFLALRNIDKFIEAFPDNKKFLNSLQKAEYRYNYKIFTKFPEMVLVILNNLFGLNILEKFFSLLDKTDENILRPFYNSISVSLPYLKVSNEDIVSFLTGIENKKKENVSNNYNIRISLTEMATEDPEKAHDLYHKIINNPDFSEIISNILFGLFRNKDSYQKAYKEANDLINNPDNPNFRAGVMALSRFNYSEHSNLLNQTYEKLVDLANNESPKILSSIARGFNYLLKQDSRAENWLVKFSKSDDKDIQEELAWALTLNNEQKTKNWYKEVLLNLTSIREHNQNISTTLYFYIKSDPELVLKFLDKWLNESDKNEGNITKIFEHIFPEVYNNQRKLFEKYITKWLNNDNYIVHQYLSNIFDDLSVFEADLELDKEELEKLNEKDINYVLFKILGYVNTYGKNILKTMVFSILKREPESKMVNVLIQDAFSSYIAYNFPGSSSEFLKEKEVKGSKLEKKMAKRILKDMTKYHENLDKLPFLSELSPSTTRIKDYYKKYNNFLNTIYSIEERKKTSIFPIDDTPIKGGKELFFKYEGEYREKTPIATIETSQEFTKGDSLDPIGMENQKVRWRLYKRE